MKNIKIMSFIGLVIGISASIEANQSYQPNIYPLPIAEQQEVMIDQPRAEVVYPQPVYREYRPVSGVAEGAATAVEGIAAGAEQAVRSIIP